MMESMEDNESRIAELESQLTAQLHQVQILVEDLQLMDEHYSAVYDKCRNALDKLEKRRTEVESLNRELCTTRDTLNAASQALSQSNNAFVKLRAQAFALQESVTIFFGDLEILHSRLERLKTTQKENDGLLGHFAVERIGEVTKGKKELGEFGQASKQLMEKVEKGASEYCSCWSPSSPPQ